MKSNRLKLDWTLDKASERNEFINEYIKTLTNPTEDELETIANYVLWGKEDDGTSASDKGDIEIETRNKTWTRSNTDSLDEMMESPTFNESTLQRLNTPLKAPHETFSRSEALKECPESMRETFKNLFQRIDELDLCINFYDLAHGKRKNPPREELLKKFSESRQEFFRERVTHWNQFFYLKQRHLLVELRREQFTLRDFYKTAHTRHGAVEPVEPELEISFGEEIPVFPLGLIGEGIGKNFFLDRKELNPSSFTEKQLKDISKFLWEKKKEMAASPKIYFNFCSLEHVYTLFQELCEMRQLAVLEDNTPRLFQTLEYYISFAELSEVQNFILDLKIKRVRNQDIADRVNKDFGKSYTANYISTIFRQKIIPKINESAALHLKIVENLFFEEEFKKCNCCGDLLLRTNDFFVKKARAKDGLANRCKKCDKEDRSNKKRRE